MIRIENLQKVYTNGSISVKALKSIDMKVKPEEFVSIMGPSGSGKSTLMNILGCLDRQSHGIYELDGIEIGALKENELAKIRNKKIGFVFQSFNLLPRISSLKNVELPMIYAAVKPHIRKIKAEKALERVGLKERMHHKSNELSGGQRQRVAIARALVNDPAIILADEPTGNLDTKAGEEIMSIFEQLNEEGVTIVMVTHEPDIAQHTKRIVTFKDGQIISDEPVQNRIILNGNL